MKAAVVTGRRHIEIREIPAPIVLPETVLLKVKLCAICGTDLVFVDDPRLDNIDKFEAVLGHEWVGEVVEVGAGLPAGPSATVPWISGRAAGNATGAVGGCITSAPALKPASPPLKAASALR